MLIQATSIHQCSHMTSFVPTGCHIEFFQERRGCFCQSFVSSPVFLGLSKFKSIDPCWEATVKIGQIDYMEAEGLVESFE